MVKYGMRYNFDTYPGADNPYAWETFVKGVLRQVEYTLNNSLRTNEFTISITELRNGEPYNG